MIEKSKDRKFIIGKLEIRPLSNTDILWLSALATCAIIHLFLKYYCPCKGFKFSFFAVWFVVFQTVSSPIGIRFRNIYFSAIWLILSILFIKIDFAYTYTPVITFMLYHIIRLKYYQIYNREFIPYQIGKGGMWKHRSKIENRMSKSEDKPFTIALLVIGIIIILISLFSINTQIPLTQLPCGICEESS